MTVTNNTYVLSLKNISLPYKRIICVPFPRGFLMSPCILLHIYALFRTSPTTYMKIKSSYTSQIVNLLTLDSGYIFTTKISDVSLSNTEFLYFLSLIFHAWNKLQNMMAGTNSLNRFNWERRKSNTIQGIKTVLEWPIMVWTAWLFIRVFKNMYSEIKNHALLFWSTL